jgi:MFS transporter, FHS family, L-fucose permease
MEAVTPAAAAGHGNRAVIKALTFAMFTMFAMTTDSVGVVIPQVIKEFGLNMTQAGAFHYTTMSAIALAGILLGSLADRLGHKRTIVLGLALFATSSYLFVLGRSFATFLVLLAASGIAIGIFKIGALALIGDISTSTTEHTKTMNAVEGFFGVGAIIGPAIVTSLLARGVSWKWLYAIAASLCVLLLLTALLVEYPRSTKVAGDPVDLGRTLRLLRDPFALAFSIGAFLYVAVECAVYVWMPTLLAGYSGSAAFVASYALSIFFVLRAGGRFVGAWMLGRFYWTTVTALFSLAILGCFVGSVLGGVALAVWLLPLSGLFMSVLYPTLNSKGISCFPKAQHGVAAGIILFFSCGAAALGPLAMGATSDAFGDVRYGFFLATGFAALLHVGLLLNWIYDPARAHLRQLDASEYDDEPALAG